MYVTLTNLGDEPELLTSPDGSLAVALHSHTPYQLNQEATTVLIVGDKPDLRDKVEHSARALGSIVRDLIELIVGRKKHAERRTGKVEDVRIVVANHGTNTVRAILGDGTTEQAIEGGSQRTLTAPGYVELRELGTVAEQNPNSAGQVAP